METIDVLDAIGNTSLVRLRKVVPSHCADVLVKLDTGGTLRADSGLKYLSTDVYGSPR
ncbi:MAG TPA: hypothetical protein VIE68_13530 [Gemmatimonadota bacterium]|jgi:hypothetical protein